MPEEVLAKFFREVFNGFIKFRSDFQCFLGLHGCVCSWKKKKKKVAEVLKIYS